MNKFLEKVKSGKKPIGVFFEMDSMMAAECIGRSGFDYIIIDNEHGVFEGESTLNAIRGANLSGVTPFVRVREISRPAIMKPLDVGAQGLIVPFVKTVEDVKNIIGWGKFSPVGSRGFCWSRKDGWGFDDIYQQPFNDYMDCINNDALLIPQCEDQQCLDSIEEITALEGVDGIFIGPYDLSIGMGIPGDFENPRFKDALERIKKACSDNGKFVMMFALEAEKGKSYLNDGYDSVTVGLDVRFYINACKEVVDKMNS